MAIQVLGFSNSVRLTYIFGCYKFYSVYLMHKEVNFFEISRLSAMVSEIMVVPFILFNTAQQQCNDLTGKKRVF
jgi:hypothetical protein